MKMSKEVENAIVTVLQFIEELDMRHIDAALDVIDLSDEAFEEELAVLKAAVGWKDE